MTRATLLSICAFALTILTVAWLSTTELRAHQRRLYEQFGADRLSQLEVAVAKVAESLDDIGDDLRLGGEFVASGHPRAQREGELRAFLEAVRQYKALAAFDEQGGAPVLLKDRRADPEVIAGRFDLPLQELAERALDHPPGTLLTSPKLTEDSGLRIFAMHVRTDRSASLAVLIDTAPLFDPLRLVSAEPGARVLVIGPHGRPAAASDPQLASLIGSRGQPPVLGRLLERMRHARGAEMISTDDARALGFAEGEAAIAYAPIEVSEGAPWAVAALFSAHPLKEHQRGLIQRLAVGGGTLAVFTVLFAAYVVMANRRAVALRESQRHARRLEHLHERAQTIVDSIPSGVLALSSAGSVTAVNRALGERLGRDVTGADLSRVFPAAPEVGATLRALLEQALSTGQPQTELAQALPLFGEPGTYNLRAVPLRAPDPEVRALLVVEDVSELVKLEAQLLRAEKLATVGVLAAGIAHEIGTPLGVVRGRAEYLLGKLPSDHPQAPGVRTMIDQIDRVSRTIQQLLDFSRLRTPTIEPASLAGAAASIVELLRLEADRRGVRMSVALPFGLPEVAADPDQLQQVLLNLAMNAVHASPAGSEVIISGRPEPSDAQGRAFVTLTVEDRGCGIPREQLHQVFDPFFTTRKRGQGTGLGLAIVAQILRSHGATIELDSEPGRGTRVNVRWPTASVERRGAHAH